MFRCARRDREEPLGEADNGTKHGKDDGRDDAEPGTLISRNPDNGTNNDKRESTNENDPAYPETVLVLPGLLLLIVWGLYMLLLCHAICPSI